MISYPDEKRVKRLQGLGIVDSESIHTLEVRVVVKLAKNKTAIAMSTAAMEMSLIVRSGSSAASIAHCSRGCG